MDWRYLFTSMDGRINRRAFWMGIVVLIVISLIASIIDLGSVDEVDSQII